MCYNISVERKDIMIRLLLQLMGYVFFAFVACVLYMYFFLNMSINEAVRRIFDTVTRTASSVRIEVPEHLSHTPSTAADNQIKRWADKL